MVIQQGLKIRSVPLVFVIKADAEILGGNIGCQFFGQLGFPLQTKNGQRGGGSRGGLRGRWSDLGSSQRSAGNQRESEGK